MRYLVAVLVLFSSPVFAETVTPPDAAAIMQLSTVRMETGGRTFCTATKVGDHLFLTARHCTEAASEFSLRFDPVFEVATPKWITVPLGTKDREGRRFDWAVIESRGVMSEVAAATYGCDEKIYLGMPVATFGYSAMSQPSFSVGYVASLTPGTRPNEYDFAVDLQVAPGASGSAIISLDTGDIIGVLTEGVAESRAGVYLIGAQLMSQTSLCGWQ